MSNKVKWMHSGMTGAPVLTNTWGSLTALLDACLVNGWNLQTVSAISRNGAVATASLPSGHGFTVDQVVLVAGCDQAEYNGEHTVTAVTATSVSFAVSGSPASPATTAGTISLKLAPLGFEIAFTGTNKRAYRSPNPLSNRHYLRVDDSLPTGYTTTWAKFGRVTIAENMADIDTFVGARAPYDPALPTKNEVPSGSGSNLTCGWFKWYYARQYGYENSGDNGAYGRSWVLIGDDRGFFLINASGYGGDKRVLHAFTDFDSYKPGDNFASYLIASERYQTVSYSGGSYPWDDARSAAAQDTTGKIALRNYTQVGDNVRLGMLALNDGNNQSISNRSANIPFPNGPDYSLILHPIYLRESVGGHLRGVLPGQYWIHQNQPYSHLSVIDNVIGYEGRKFLIVTMDYGSEGNASGFAYDITGPWRP
jgi:hypothetical protein